MDGVKNTLIQSDALKLNPSKSNHHALVSAAPIFLGGAPKNVMKSISRAGVIGVTSGFVGKFIEHFNYVHLNNRCFLTVHPNFFLLSRVH